MIELLNTINITVSQAPVGLGAYNVNNLALFTSDPFLSNPGSDNFRIYVSPAAVAADFGSNSETHQQAVAVFSQQPNVLAGGGRLIIFPMDTGNSETLAAAITRCKDMVFFCGIISTSYPASGSMLALSNQVQAYGDKILMLPSATFADIAGAFSSIKSASNIYTRCIYRSTTALEARLQAAAAAGRGFSTDFAGSLTAQTMNLKPLVTITADAGITQTIYDACLTAGVDIYVDQAGVSVYVSSGGNKFFDEVYNLIWFVCALKVAGFNALAQVGTKVAQTEPGISLLKGAYRQVCEQALSNGYLAPGSWTAPEYFGVQDDFIKNIGQRGFYIYSQPVTKQLASDRAARKAPLIQIAGKEAGAVHSSALIVSINP